MDPSAPNPYQPPSDLEPPADETSVVDRSATRSERLGAAMIDGLISSVIFLPIQIWAGVYDGFPHVKPQQFPLPLAWTLGGIVLWLAVHGVFLARSAQTVGKKLVGTQIVMVKDGRPAPLSRLVLWRFLPTMLVPQIPMVGAVLSCVDVLLIFRKDRRCLHDHIAGTRVVSLSTT
jgi:uncharacterized RDD family membrane protein YckC